MPKKGYKQTEEHINKISKGHKGLKWSDETRRKLIPKLTKIFNTPEYKQKQRESHYGEKSGMWKGGVSEKYKKRVGLMRNISHKEYWANPKYHTLRLKNLRKSHKKQEFCDNVSKRMKGIKKTEEAKRKMSETRKRLFREGKIESWNKDMKMSGDYLMIYRKAFYNSKNMKNRIQGLILKPNRPENILIKLIKQNNLPYKYTGDGNFIIGNKCPDFVNVNGQKKVIEMFGDYWHNNKKTRWHQTEFGTKAIYSQYGFKTLIIWEHELKDIDNVLERIKRFEN